MTATGTDRGRITYKMKELLRRWWTLGEMYQELTVQGVKIPNGFATTSGAYWHLLESAGILDKLKGSFGRTRQKEQRV